MPVDYAKHLGSTPQTEQADPAQVPNSAGGFSFAVDKWQRLRRFLVLGAEGGTYYVSERKLVVENVESLKQCYAEDPRKTVDLIVEVSEAGRAPKNDHAVFALAFLSRDPYALSQLPRVCRIGTHLFQFIKQARHFRGRGRAFNSAIRSWYKLKSEYPRDLAYQLVKYQQRDGWAHRDVLRLVKPVVEGPASVAFRWAVGKPVTDLELVQNGLEPIAAFELAKKATNAKQIVNLIEKHRLVRECIPTQFLNDAGVWEALLQEMPLTAMVRNLGKMSSIGLLAPLSAASKLVVERLRNSEALKKARVHPVALLIAQKIYQQGRGEKGSLSWSPVQNVVDALDEAFYLAFDAVEPTGKRWFLGLDVSGSMTSPISSSVPLSCCEGATAMAMVTAATEENSFIGRFNTGIQPCPFGRKTRLAEALRYTRNINGGGTDCSLPMQYALQKKIPVDVFAVYTDSETWAGEPHPHQALEKYRQKTGIPAKLIVVGMNSNGFTIADPNDAGMLDVVGFDTSTPAVMAEFAR